MSAFNKPPPSLEDAERLSKFFIVMPVPKPGIKIGKKVYNGKAACIKDWPNITEEEMETQMQTWFNGKNENNIAIVLKNDGLVIDIDGEKCEKIIWKILVPKLSFELQEAFRKTARTRTGGGGEHILFGINSEEFPDGIVSKKYLVLGKHEEIKLNANGNYAVERGIHESGEEYQASVDIEHLVYLSKDQVEELLSALSNLKSEAQAQTPKQKQKQSKQSKRKQPQEEEAKVYSLDDTKVEIIVKELEPWYQGGSRDEITFSCSGYLHKWQIDEDSTMKLIEGLVLITNDEELASRRQTVHTTFAKKRHSSEVSGWNRFVEALTLVTKNRFKAEVIVRKIGRTVTLARKEQGANQDEKTFGPDQEQEQGQEQGQGQEGQEEETGESIYSVKEASRLNSGYAKVRGVISTVTPLRKMIKATTFTCINCGVVHEFEYKDSELDPKPTFEPNRKEYGTSRCINCSEKYFRIEDSLTNAIVVELKDADAYSELDLLHTILFEDDTKDIQPGEIVIVDGKIHALVGAGHSKIILPYLYAKSIKYELRKEITLTKADREAIQRFINKHGTAKIIDRLVEMFACNIIGYDDVKRCVLFCEVLTNLDITQKKINILLLGDTGLSKTDMLVAATKLNPKSRFESGENSSGKTLTAIISNEEGEGRKLNIGAVPSSKGGICGINEIGRMSGSDQGHLLGVMQEQFFTINKHGIHVRINAPTSIIASANPVQGKFQDTEKVDINEIPMIIPLIDRCDYTFPYRMNRDEAYQRDYADRVSEFDNRKAPDYSAYLMKHMMYAKELCPCPEISDKATILLNDYYANVVKELGSPRVRNTLIKTVRAIAMLKLKKIVDEEDVQDAMKYYSAYLKQLQKLTIDPVTHYSVDLIYSEILNVIKESTFDISLEEAAISAAARNVEVARHLNNKYKLQNNRKLQRVYEMLVKHTSIRLVTKKPVVFHWITEQEQTSQQQ